MFYRSVLFGLFNDIFFNCMLYVIRYCKVLSQHLLWKNNVNLEKAPDNQFLERDSILLSPECEAEVVTAVFGNMSYRFTRRPELTVCVLEYLSLALNNNL
jgi:hypothetical protein